MANIVEIKMSDQYNGAILSPAGTARLGEYLAAVNAAHGTQLYLGGFSNYVSIFGGKVESVKVGAEATPSIGACDLNWITAYVVDLNSPNYWSVIGLVQAHNSQALKDAFDNAGFFAQTPTTGLGNSFNLGDKREKYQANHGESSSMGNFKQDSFIDLEDTANLQVVPNDGIQATYRCAGGMQHICDMDVSRSIKRGLGPSSYSKLSMPNLDHSLDEAGTIGPAVSGFNVNQILDGGQFVIEVPLIGSARTHIFKTLV